MLEKTKKILTKLFIMGLVFASLGTTTQVHAKSTKSNWYKPIMTSSRIKANGQKSYTYLWNYNKYNLVDINKDGCKELIIHKPCCDTNYSDPDNKVMILSWHKGKIYTKTVNAGPYGFSKVYYDKKGKQLIVWSRKDNRNSTFTSFKLKNGKLKQVHKVTSGLPMFSSSYVYTLDGKKVSSQKVNSITNKWFKNPEIPLNKLLPRWD